MRKKRKHGLGWIFQPVYTCPKTRERKPVTIWWIQYCRGGTVYRESSRSNKRSDATILLKKRLAAQGRFINPAEAGRLTFQELSQMLLDDYGTNQRKSLKSAQKVVKQLQSYFGAESRVQNIKTNDINQYIQVRQEKVKPATVQNELSALKRMFNLAVRAERLPDKPYIPSLKFHNTREGFFEAPEFRSVLQQLPEDIQPLIEFLYLTGWRVGEVRPLPWRQVDFQARVVRLEAGFTKNQEGRTFPFEDYPPLAELLERQRERTDRVEKATEQIITHVFHRQGEPIREFRGAWVKACAKAGLDGKLVHDLRRTAVRNLERAGVPRSVAMKLTGHRTESVYRRYAIVSESDLSEGVGKLAVLHKQKKGDPRKVVPMQR